MTPAQHYAEAQRLLAADQGEIPDDVRWRLLQRAQIHATLALVRPTIAAQAGQS